MVPRPSAPAAPTELVAPAFVPSFEPPAPPPAFPDPVPALAPRHGQPPAFQEPMAILSPHLAAASGASDEPTTIDFGPDAGGMASKSYGDNAIDAILADMVKRRASDLHITCGEPYCYRVDGDITRIGQDPVDAAQMEQYLGPIMPERNRREFLKQNDTDFAYEIDGVGRFRVNIFRDKNGAGAVLRHIPSKILTAEQLHLPPAITKFCDLNKGLVLVTGPTGSGKSTTLAAMIDMINKNRADHILTIEDPIEFVHPQHKCLVNQREVHKHTTSFSRALKAALREDPDIVLIGEMRDLETIAIAIETAETGHLVFGTLHTTTAVSTVDRIIDQFPSDRQEQIRMMLAASLRGVVAQTLLKKKGGGRVAAHEILVTNDAVSAMIREGKNHMISNHMQSQKADGNQLLNEALARHVKEGIVEAEEAYRKAVDKASLAEMFRRMNVSVPGMAPAPGGQRPPGGPRTA
jgi:twitching motility protein PilT